LLDVLAGDREESVRAAAALALGYIGRSDLSVPALIDAMQEPAPLVRVHASQALGRVGRAAAAAREDLTRAQKDPHPDVQRNAREALRRLDSPRRR
jgi:HEAT repeat protein